MNKTLKISIIFSLMLFFAAQAKAQVSVIVNAGNSVKEMKAIEVKLYFMKKIKKEWPSGDAIKPVLFKGTSIAKDHFLSDVMKMSETEVTNYFKQQQFANGEPLPSTFATEQEVIEYVGSNPGAIGFISTNNYKAGSSNVRSVLTIK